LNSKNPITVSGLLLGIGLGGFFDGIFFHQILQIHNMLSNIYFPDTLVKSEINMFWDGLFHLFTWLITILGIFFLWQGFNNGVKNKNGYNFIGLLLIGWGIFNLVEGTLDHMILKLHHVVQRASAQGQLMSDIAFLFFGMLLCGIGFWLCYKNKRASLE
jgi:uncharacterized membrane protein